MRTVDRRVARNRSMTENTVFEGRTPGCASDEPMARTDPRQLTWSEAQGSRTAQYQNNYLLQQMTIMCATVQSLGKQMHDLQNLGKQMQGGLQLKESGDRKRLQEYGKDDVRKDGRRFQEQTTGQTAGPK